MESKRVVRSGVFCLTVVTALFSGCVTGENYHPMSTGLLATPGCVIRAEDNSFTIASGQEFQPPFQLDCSRTLHKYYFDGNNFEPGNSANLVKYAGAALKRGAQRVRVTVLGFSEPLYGVLALFDISDSGTGPGSRSYRIEIPQQYTDGATGGRVSVIYETYLRPGSLYYTTDTANIPSWVLWLSDQPF